MKKKVMIIAAAMAAFSVLPAFGQDAGFGKDIPLQLAIKQIVPDDMSVNLASGVDGNVKVSWTGEGGWRKALEQAIAGTGYTYAVDGSKVTVTGAAVQTAAAPQPPAVQPSAAPAAPRPAAPAAPRPQNNASSQPSRPAAPAAPRPVQQTASVPVVPGAGFVLIPESGPRPAAAGAGEWQTYGTAPAPAPQAEWVVSSGASLHAVLEEWAQRADWTLVWESEYVYELTSSAKFSGDFVTAAAELLRSMQDVRPVVTAEFHQGNKVLVIANNNFDEAN